VNPGKSSLIDRSFAASSHAPVDHMLTEAQFASIFPAVPQAKRRAFLPLLIAAMEEFEINTRTRVAAFLAQVVDESQGSDLRSD
jgi:predicted chitinase